MSKPFEFFKQEDADGNKGPRSDGWIYIGNANRLLNERGQYVSRIDGMGPRGSWSECDETPANDHYTHEGLIICQRPIEREPKCDLCPQIMRMEHHTYINMGDDFNTTFNVELKPVECPKCGKDLR